MSQLAKRGAELVVDGRGRHLSSRIGTYSDNVTVTLAKKFQGKIVTVRDIARVQYGRLTDRNERYVRNRLTKAVNMLLSAGIPAYPVYESTGPHKKVGIKVVTEYSDEDYDKLTAYQDAAVARGDISYAKADLVDKAIKALKDKPAA